MFPAPINKKRGALPEGR